MFAICATYAIFVFRLNSSPILHYVHIPDARNFPSASHFLQFSQSTQPLIAVCAVCAILVINLNVVVAFPEDFAPLIT